MTQAKHPPIYLDYHASTPLDPRVLRVYEQHLKSTFANASSSSHQLGREAGQIVEAARTQIAHLIGAANDEIIFTSGATESIHLALCGVVEMYPRKGCHLITQATEHRAVLETCKHLEKKGVRVTYLPVDRMGRIRLEDLEKAICSETLLVSIMHANNEVGTVHPIAEIGKITKQRRFFFHVDGAQTVGKLSVDVNRDGIDLLSFSGHKMYGPKGVGALYVRKENPRVRLLPQTFGGGQERGLRPGTLNVPAIAAFGEACAVAAHCLENDEKKIGSLLKKFSAELQKNLEGLHFNGDPDHRLYNHLSLSFDRVSSAELFHLTQQDLALSSGSACASGSPEASHVLKAMGFSARQIHETVRIGFGRMTSSSDADRAALAIIQAVKKIRRAAPRL